MLEIVHTPVLLKECLTLLCPEKGYTDEAWMIDSTLGEGGHSEAFLNAFPSLNVIGIDADSVIQETAKRRLSHFGDRMHFYNGWFTDFYESYPVEFPKPNLILFDLGISVFHYEKSGRGFSFRYDEALDMRLNPEKQVVSAADIVNGYGEEELSNVLFLYGEEKLSRRFARAIVEVRRGGKIESSKTLADIIFRASPSAYRYGAIHPATRTFQALRIAVNSELRIIPPALHNAFNCLKIGGKLGVITFHSLEDRIVKTYFRNLGKKCVCPPEFACCKCGGVQCADVLTKKPVCASDAEVKENAPSRSAKLRVVRKLSNATEYHLNGVEGF